MKIKITESQLKRVIKKYQETNELNEAWYDDVLDFVKTSYEVTKEKTKEIFKDLTGVDFSKKDDIKKDEIPTGNEIDNKIDGKKIKVGNIFGNDRPRWGKSNSGYENGPINHGKRPLGNWQSDNAWDIFGKPGTKVYAITPGFVKKVRVSNNKKGKIFGTQVTIEGTDGYPDVFYTHLKNVNLTSGEKIKAGELVGEISEWDSNPTITHVHIGLDRGHIRNYLSVNGDIHIKK